MNIKEIKEMIALMAEAQMMPAVFLNTDPLIRRKPLRNHLVLFLAEYLYSLAKCFNDFYRDVPVLKADNEVRLARVALLEATRIVLENGLNLLGIESPERL